MTAPAPSPREAELPREAKTVKTRISKRTRRILVAAAVVLLVMAVVVVTWACQREKATIVEGVPDYVVDYAANFDGLYLVTLQSQHPDVEEQLGSPEVQEAFLKWLTTDAAWKPEMSSVTWGAIRAIYPRRSEQDAKVVRPFLKHEDRRVREQAYSVLVSHVFGKPEKRKDLLALLQQMLQDSSPYVQKLALGFVERSKAQEDLRPDLEALKSQVEKLTPKTEVCELLERILDKPEQ